MQIPFVGPTYSGRSTDWDAQRCVNWYVEMAQNNQGSKSPVALYNTPGLKPVAELMYNCRGMYSVPKNTVSGSKVDDRLYVMDRENVTYIAAPLYGTLYQYDTHLDTGFDYGKAIFAFNGEALLICDGVRHVLDTTTFVTPKVYNHVIDGVQTWLNGAGQDLVDIAIHDVAFLDGYFIAQEAYSGVFYVSDYMDGTAWQVGLNYATAESASDTTYRVMVDHEELWLFGEHTTEVWTNVGDPDFPFQRIPGSVSEWGVVSAGSVAKMNDVIFWLARSYQGGNRVVATNGYRPVPISTSSIEYKIDALTRPNDAIAFTYHQEGHDFYVLSFQFDGLTLVYDITTGMWHERSSDGLDNMWKPMYHAYYRGKNIVGFDSEPYLYELDMDQYYDRYGLLDDETAIHRMRRTQTLSNDELKIFFNRLELDFEMGVGRSGTDWSAPLIMLRYSDDGGHTWSNEMLASMGRIGEYSKRAIFRKLGASRNRIWELRITDHVKPILMGASARIGMGSQ